MRGNRAYVLSQMIINPSELPPDIKKSFEQNENLARQFLIKALIMDIRYHEIDIKTDYKVRQQKIETNKEAIRKLRERVSTPDPGGLT